MNTHEGINEAAQLLHEAVQELMSTLEEVASSTGMVNTMLDTISKSMAKVQYNCTHGSCYVCDFLIALMHFVHLCILAFKNVGAMHIICHINKFTSRKIDSTYLG